MTRETRSLFHLHLIGVLKTGKMKEIKLTQGKVALVDDEDFEYLNQFKWHSSRGRCTTYVSRYSYGNIQVLMHRVIMNTPPHMQVDHIDHDGLNNQKVNLRNCTSTQNMVNRIKRRGASQYNGVDIHIIKSKNKTYKYIRAVIKINRKQIYIGHYKTEKDAAVAYDKMAIKLYGEFANLNFKE